MKKNLVKLFIIGVIALLSSNFINAQDFSSDNRTLMTIGGDDISVAEFMNVYMKNNVNGDVLDKKTMEEYLELYINYKLKVKEAEAEGLDTVKSFIVELDGYRTQLAKPYFVDEEINNSLIQEAYERMLIDIRASHILIKCEADALPEDTLKAFNIANDARQRVINGEDFAVVATELSEDPSARDREPANGKPGFPGNKGDLGYFTVFNMVYPFENAAYTTTVGEVSQPIRSRFGYHVVQVNEREDALGKVLAAHIFLPLSPEASQEEVDSINAIAKTAWDALENGQSWADAVKTYSRDKGSIPNQGKLPWFNVNRMVPEVIAEIYKLDTGEYSAPFRTSYGVHIVKYLDQKPIKPFEEVKGSIKSSLAKDMRAKLGKTTILNRIKKEYNLKIYKKNLAKFNDVVTDSIFTGSWRAEEASKLKKPIFKLGDTTLTQQQFAVVVEANQQHGKVLSEKERLILVNNILNKWIDKTCLAYEDSQLERKHIDFAMLMKEYRDGILLFELMDQKVWTKAIEDTVGLDNFYQKNKTNYMWPERRDVSEFTITGFADTTATENFLTVISESFENNSSDEDILAIIEADSTLKVNYLNKLYVENDNPKVDAFKLENGAPEFKIKSGNNEISIIRVNAIVEPQPKELKEAKGLVTADYQTFLEKAWIKNLREQYPYSKNEKVWESLNQK